MPSMGHFFVWNGAYRMCIKHTFRKTKIDGLMSKMKLIFRSQMEELYRFHGFVWVGCSFISTFYFIMKARDQFFEPFDQHYLTSISWSPNWISRKNMGKWENIGKNGLYEGSYTESPSLQMHNMVFFYFGKL